MINRKKYAESYLILQKNVRAWCTLRTWNWYKLYGSVKPLFKINKLGENVEHLENKFQTIESFYKKEEKKHKLIEIERLEVFTNKEIILKELNLIKSNENLIKDKVIYLKKKLFYKKFIKLKLKFCKIINFLNF